MGLGTLYPPEVMWERCAVHDRRIQTSCLFGHSSPLAGETSVSCLIVTTVQARVHITFPMPFTPATFPRLVRGIGTDSRQPCVLAHGLFNRSSAPPDYSRRTYGRGHAVPSVVLVENKTQKAVALSLPVLPIAKLFATRCNKAFPCGNMSPIDSESRPFGTQFTITAP